VRNRWIIGDPDHPARSQRLMQRPAQNEKARRNRAFVEREKGFEPRQSIRIAEVFAMRV
jgi:hypothetical protein